MKHKQRRPLNPAFADTPTSQLVRMLEEACVFTSSSIETELSIRLEQSGRLWRFVAPGKIELYYPGKIRPKQRECNVGLFDNDTLSQLDVMDAIWNSKL